MAICCGLVGWASAAAPPALAAPPAVEGPSSFVQIDEKISDHVHLLRLPTTMFLDPTGNVIVIEQSDGLVLVDSGGYFGAGQRVVETVKAISPKPVKVLILTHYHSDHSFGVPAILQTWPNAEFLAHEGTLKAMAEGRPPGAPRQPSGEFEQQRQSRLRSSFAKQAEAAADVTTPEERAGWARELATLEQRLADFPGTYTILPRRTFRDRLDLPDRMTPVQVLFLGRANTPGDALVWLPSERILATGDILVAPIPYMFDVYPVEMRQVFQRIRRMNPKLIIPGHGSSQTLAYLDKVDRLVSDVRTRVRALAKKQLPLKKIQERIDGSTHRKVFAGTDPWLGFWFDNYAWLSLIESVFHEARGEPLGPPPVAKSP